MKLSRQSLLNSFVLAKPAGYKVFSPAETIHYEKKSVFKDYNILSRRGQSRRS